MTVLVCVREKLKKGRSLFVLCGATVFCLASLSVQAQPNPNQLNLTFEPEVQPQKEDYMKARRNFRTKLTQKVSSPQIVPMPDAPAGVTVIEFPSGDLRLKAWINLPDKPTKAKIPAVIFLHGGFGFVKAHWNMTQPYRDAGFIVLMPILRGENGQGGNFTLLYDEVEDVLAVADFLSNQSFVDARNIFVAGHSVGGTLTLLAAQASNRFRAAAALSGSPDQKLMTRLFFPKDKVPFDVTDPREFEMRSPLAYATSFKCPTRIYYGSEERVFDLTSRRTAELASKAKLDVATVVTQGNHDSHVKPSIKHSIEFFEKSLDTKSKQLLSERRAAAPPPGITVKTTFRLKGFENAKTVALAGTFNDWNPRELLFTKENGVWVYRIDLTTGKHFYKFVVDDNWILDPENPEKADDGNGNMNSVLVVKP